MPGPPPKPPGQGQGHRSRPRLEVVQRDPAAPVVVPEPPKGLSKGTRRRWEAYWRSPVAQAADISSDGGLLDRWIRAVDEHEKVGKVFRQGRIVKGSMGQPVMNPLATYLVQLEATIKHAEQQLGLTPLSRVRLGVTIGQARLTADALNRSLSEPTPHGPEADAIDGEWTEA